MMHNRNNCSISLHPGQIFNEGLMIGYHDLILECRRHPGNPIALVRSAAARQAGVPLHLRLPGTSAAAPLLPARLCRIEKVSAVGAARPQTEDSAAPETMN